MADSQIDEIKSKLDIVSIVQEYVPSLKRSGRNYFGLCPFHNEKSPSFSVNPEIGIYKCFGCGEGGDVISFLQKLEGLDFIEALNLAAQRAGVTLRNSTAQDSKFRKKKDRALRAHKLAADYYHYILLEHKLGQKGLKYAIDKRKLTDKVLKEYKIGYAPPAFHNLENFLLKKKFTKLELVEFGLLVSKNGRVYDKFRDRLLNPLFNMRGEVIGFSGRALSDQEKGPKYLNSPETIIYHKKNELYGAFQAKESMRKQNKVVVVEGNIDVLSSAKADMQNIVCPLGTALTLEQVTLLKRYIDTVLFCFDTDSAGKKALLRALQITEKVGIISKAIKLPTGFKDPDELICSDQLLWRKSVEQALDIPEFIMEVYKDDYDIVTAQGKKDYLELVVPYLRLINNDIRTDHYLQKLEMITGTKYSILQKLLNNSVEKSNSIRNMTPNNEIKPVENNTAIAAKQTNATSDGAELAYPVAFTRLIATIYRYFDFITPENPSMNLIRERIEYLLPAEKDLLEELLVKRKITAARKIIESETITPHEFSSKDSYDEQLLSLVTSYVKRRIKSYIQLLKNKLKNIDLEKSHTDANNNPESEILGRINDYIKLLSSFELSRDR